MDRIKALFLSMFLLFASFASAAFETAGTGSDQNFVISDNAILDNLDADWTWAFYWNHTAVQAGTDRHVVSNINGTTINPGFVVYCSNTSGPQNLIVRNNDDATGDQSSSSSAQECNTINTWRRLVITHSGNDLKVYLDNIQIASSSTVVGASSGPAGGLFFGTRPDLGSDSADKYCDIAKWTRVLNSDERNTLQKYSASKLTQGQTIFIPAIREFIELRTPLTITNNGSTIADCPPLIR